MNDRFRRLSREGFWIVLGQGMAVLGALIGVRVLTGLLDPAQYGELALGMTLATLVNQTVLGPLGNGVVRFYAPALDKDDLGGYLMAIRRLAMTGTSVILALTACVALGLALSGHSSWIVIAVAALVFSLLSGCSTILNGIQNAARQRAIVALHQGMESWLRFSLAVALMVWVGKTSTIAMLGYAVAALLVLGSQLRFFRRISVRSGVPHEPDAWRWRIWEYSWPFGVWGVFTFAQLASDRWALEVFATTEDVGLYGVLYQLGYYPILLGIGMVAQFIGPILYQRAGDATDRDRVAGVSRSSWRLMAITLGVTSLAFLGCLLLHEQIFRLLVAAEYAGVSHLLPWMMVAGGIFAAAQTVGLNLLSRMQTRAMMVAKIITAVIGVGLNFAGARGWGITGIVGAAVIFSVIHFVWLTLLSLRLDEQRAGS